MAYQRTEYADKTLSMNSLADRKLKLKLGSIESHKETIEKELKRERKKLEKELGVEDQLRTRLSVNDLGDSSRSLSPRLPRRYSTPPELLSASVPPPVADPRRSPVTRRRFGSEGMNDPLSCDPSSANTALLSPTSMFLKAPFDQPRRQSLPPIGDGGLLSAESGHRRDRRGSYGGTIPKSPVLTPSPNISGSSTPRRALSRNSSSLNEAQMNEITAKVSKFLQKIDNKDQNENKTSEEIQEKGSERTDKQTENTFDSCHQESLSLPPKNTTQVGMFQPLNFE